VYSQQAFDQQRYLPGINAVDQVSFRSGGDGSRRKKRAPNKMLRAAGDELASHGLRSSVTKSISMSANVNVVVNAPMTSSGGLRPTTSNVYEQLFGAGNSGGFGSNSPQVAYPHEPEVVDQASVTPTQALVPATPGNFVARIRQHISSVDDIVSIDRFYAEKNLSYARIVKRDNKKELLSLSSKAPAVNQQYAAGVNPTAWIRPWYKENYLVQKAGFASNFGSLANQITKVMQSTGGAKELPAIRYHTYTSHCKVVKALGDPNVLPIPVMLTFRLDLDIGHFSGDTQGKTCIWKKPTSTVAQCDFMSGVPSSLERCKESMKSFLDVIDSPKILLLVTSQQHSFVHPKLLSLPQGVTRDIAAQVVKFHRKPDVERSILVAISNFFGDYSTRVILLDYQNILLMLISLRLAQVISHFSRFFHFSASFDYDSSNRIDPLFLAEYLEKFSMSKFVLCPNG
jgi:hypothetical protein